MFIEVSLFKEDKENIEAKLVKIYSASHTHTNKKPCNSKLMELSEFCNVYLLCPIIKYCR